MYLDNKYTKKLNELYGFIINLNVICYLFVIHIIIIMMKILINNNNNNNDDNKK